MILPRRQFLTGLGALLAAPAIVRASNIMPVRSLPFDPYVLKGKLFVGFPPESIPVIAGSVVCSSDMNWIAIGTGIVSIDKIDESPLLKPIGRTVGIPEWGLLL